MDENIRMKRLSFSLSMLYRGLLTFPLVLFSIAAGSYASSDFRFTIEPRDTIVADGRSVVLDCAAQYPDTKPQIRWKKDGTFITLDRRRSLLQNGSLYMEEVEHSRMHQPDQGVYQCTASVPNVGSIDSSQATLTIAYLEKAFDEEPEDMTVHLGDTAMFSCSIQGAPKPTITWYRDDMQIGPYDVNYHIHQDGVLEIQSVQFLHLGRYKCKAENLDRSRFSEVIVLQQNSDSTSYLGVAPEFVMVPHDTVSTEGATVMLYCGANGRDRSDESPTISWLKDGTTIDMSDLDSRFSKVGQGSLRIDALHPDDSGAYTCRATNDEDSIDAVATLSVHVAPTFLRRPKTISTIVNSDVEFECEVDGIPKPQITWLHNGDVITPTNYFQIINGHNLRILGVVEMDAGMYQCFAENSVGSIESSAHMAVVKPDNSTASLVDLPSAPRNLEAAFVSTRFVTLSWQPPINSGKSEVINYVVYFKEENSDRERTQNATQVEANIQHLKPGAAYIFRVVAFNAAGPSHTAAQITATTMPELSVPGPPQNLQVHPLSQHSVEVEWSAPLVATDITTYKLFYYEVGADDEIDVNTDLVTRYTLSNLNGYTSYSVRVLAYNINGAGESTEEIIVQTYSGKPESAPSNVTAEATSSTSVEIHWEPPPADDCNGIITGYKIRYREQSDRANTVTTDGNRRDFILTSLKAKTTYQIRLLAMTQNGTGPASEWINVDTLETDLEETIVPGQPRALHVRSMTDSILISWTPPAEQDIMIRGYVLGYGINMPDVFKQVLKAKQRYYTIKNLVPDSNYVLSLRAFNKVGDGVPIYETANTRRATTPEPQTPMETPLGLKAVVLTANTVLLSWTDQSLGDSQKVTDNRYYTVAFNPKTSPRKKFINSTELNAHIEDLKPDTEYEFSVRVSKGRRRSPPSMSVFVKTYEAEPATTPRDLTPVGHPDEPQWVILSWQPPRTPNGQLTGYIIYYTTDSSQDDDKWVQHRLSGDVLNTVIHDLSLETTYYFKVQAKNSKGYGPPSPTVLYRTPRADGRGGGMLELPDDYGKSLDRASYRPGYDYGKNSGSDNRNQPSSNQNNQDATEKGGLPPMVMWIIIGTISGITVIVVVVVTVILCRRKMTDADRKKKRGPGYVPANKGPKDLKPPDLWIDQMELKNIDRSGNRDTTASVSPLPRDQDLDGGSGDRNYDPTNNEDRYQRTPIRPKASKPIMFAVDQPPPSRELAVAMAVPNGHLAGSDLALNPTPVRPVYPRTQYSAQYTSTPRVNAGDVTAPPAVRPQPQQPPPPQTTSPYKNKVPPGSSQAHLARSPLPVVGPRAPDVTRCGKDDSSDYGPKSVSTEDLTAQMANLEGLMKDLNAITQQEFEC